MESLAYEASKCASPLILLQMETCVQWITKITVFGIFCLKTL